MQTDDAKPTTDTQYECQCRTVGCGWRGEVQAIAKCPQCGGRYLEKVRVEER